MKHYNILIATPGTNFVHQYVQSLTETMSACAERGLSVKWLNGQSSLVHQARELTASGGGFCGLDPHQKSPGRDLTYDVIIWIDSDISWTVDDFFKLVNSPYDVTTGVYMVTNGATTVSAFNVAGCIPVKKILAMTKPERVHTCGFGFVCMKRGVFERLRRPWFTHEQQKVAEDADGLDVIDCLGEDVSWCNKAYHAGIQIWFDPSVRVVHNKVTGLVVG